MPTSTPDSWTSFQNGSNSGSANRPAPEAVSGHRGGADEDRPGAALDYVLELPDRLVDDRQVDDRGREDPVLEVEGPVLVHPLVERVHDHRVAFGSSASRSSSRLARVGHIIARSTCCSSISSIRSSG
jgi:hypothetical protein